MIILSILCISLVLMLGASVGFFYWYVRSTSKYFLQVSDAYKDVVETVEEFRAHLDLVAEMERFIGEPIIDNLQKHTAQVSAMLKEIEQSITFQETGKTDESTEKSE